MLIPMPMGMSWHDYNRALIERGRTLIMDFSFLDSWNKELEEMNRGREVHLPKLLYRVPFLHQGWI
jgi:hypothetical protein